MTTPNDFHFQQRHDTLEVNNYLMSGLVVSSIDKWFMGPVPQFDPKDLGIADAGTNLNSAIEQARIAAGQTKWELVCL